MSESTASRRCFSCGVFVAGVSSNRSLGARASGSFWLQTRDGNACIAIRKFAAAKGPLEAALWAYRLEQ